jgi:pepF/M3 family oligoendopeptidase
MDTKGEVYFMTTSHPLPRWDMTTVYPGLETPEFEEGFAKTVQNIADLGDLFDRYAVGEKRSQAVETGIVEVFETLTIHYNTVQEDTRTLIAYINSFILTDSQNKVAQARMSELQGASVALSLLTTRYTAWVGLLDIEKLVEDTQIARDHSYALYRAKEQASHLMSAREEALAAELNVSDGTAWAKLHGNLTSQLVVNVEVDGQNKELPMSTIRNMAYDRKREVRAQAYAAEIEGWERAALPLAAALNSIKSEVLVTTKRRSWASPLDASLWVNSIDQQILDAMLVTARAAFPDFRRYLHSKARALSLTRLAWYDLFAPIGNSKRVWEFEEATTFIIEQFGTYSSRLSDFAARAVREHWIDAEPRVGKRDGALCMWLCGDQSRVMANFKPVFAGVSTLAHELGHGYHNLNLAQRTSLQRSHPMTLAETASIFCETIIRQAALKQASSSEQIVILEAALQGTCQVVVDISSRFLFEQRVFEKRKQRELSIEEFNQLMLEAQHETYGDGLDEGMLHPYMWAVKQHYYNVSRSYYNYPYMFGQLFGLGLYARYQQDPERFKQGYDDLLASTGMADAATLAARFGIDLRTEEFWQSSLDIIRGDIERFVGAVEEMGG